MKDRWETPCCSSGFVGALGRWEQLLVVCEDWKLHLEMCCEWQLWGGWCSSAGWAGPGECTEGGYGEGTSPIGTVQNQEGTELQMSIPLPEHPIAQAEQFSSWTGSSVRTASTQPQGTEYPTGGSAGSSWALLT